MKLLVKILLAVSVPSVLILDSFSVRQWKHKSFQENSSGELGQKLSKPDGQENDLNMSLAEQQSSRSKSNSSSPYSSLSEARGLHSSSSSSSSSNGSFAFDYDDLKVFENSNCYPVEHICRSSKDYSNWVYKSSNNRSSHTHSKYQPEFIMDMSWAKHLGIPIRVRVHNSSSQQQFNPSQCRTSKIANHLVVTGSYNNMVMESFLHIVPGLWELWNGVSAPWWKEEPNSPHTVVYSVTHDQKEKDRDKVPSSFPAFMAGFTANPVEKFLDLFRGSTRQDDEDCECFERLVFCGFSDANEHDIERYHHALKQGKNVSFPDLSAVKRIQPGAEVGHASKKLYKKGEERIWSLIRNHTRQGAFRNYTGLSDRIIAYKKDALMQNSHPAQASENLDQWSFVGFSQRLGRRRWLNLPDILKNCNQKWQKHKIVCLQVELESPKSQMPENQVAMHAALDALIGIHGSQNVHQVWLPDGAFVMEMLPHLIGPWGFWTQLTNGDTINGKMNRQTTLNHLGYPLNSSSIPDCEGQYRNITKCNNATRWNDRDFVVEGSVIDSFMSKFIAPLTVDDHTGLIQSASKHPLMPCDHYNELADHEFVLYNINCWENNTHKVQHYYRERNTFAHLSET